MKYHVMWELDNSRVSADPNERRAQLEKARAFTDQYFKQHPGEDWGAFPGENRGYWSGATKWQDLSIVSQALAPYYTLTVHQAVSLSELTEWWDSITKK